MCAGDDRNCPQFELHLQEPLDAERGSFLKSTFVASGGALAAWASGACRTSVRADRTTPR